MKLQVDSCEPKCCIHQKETGKKIRTAVKAVLSPRIPQRGKSPKRVLGDFPEKSEYADRYMQQLYNSRELSKLRVRIMERVSMRSNVEFLSCFDLIITTSRMQSGDKGVSVSV